MAKEKAVPVLSAENPHELMRAIEVQDIIELSEIHARASLARTESRMTPCHYRVDYPRQMTLIGQVKLLLCKTLKAKLYTLLKNWNSGGNQMSKYIMDPK